MNNINKVKTELLNIKAEIEELKGCGLFNLSEASMIHKFEEMDNEYMLNDYDFSDISELRDLQHDLIECIEEGQNNFINSVMIEALELTDISAKDIKIYNNFGGLCIDVNNQHSISSLISFNLFYDADDDYTVEYITSSIEKTYNKQVERVNVNIVR